ncbi:MAG: glutamate--tRNA ligase [Candidatus Altiarchaeota archaeon]
MAESTLTLPGDPKGAVLRFAPNPNGPLSIGHARGVITNNYLAKKYGGKFILRFDDTDPKTKKPVKDAYGWIPEDCRWLGCEPDMVVTASENMDTYYSYAQELIKSGHAYICACEREAFKTLKDQKMACPHRNQTPEVSLSGWKGMLTSTKEGESVLRIKTDMENPDPALRDWAAFRILEAEHPLVGKRYRVWPMLDFESAIEDHIRAVTHIIRGIDLADSGLKQKYLYDYFGWTYPEVILWGRLQIEETGKFSTSKMAQDIASGLLTGWDDPRIPTLRALRRRGIQAESIKELMLGFGLSDNAASLSLENLYSINRRNLDQKTNRYFFIPDPVKLLAVGMPGKTVRMPLHPSFKERGVREQCYDTGGCLFIPKKDTDLKVGDVIKLMGLSCIAVESVDDGILKARYVPDENKKAKKVQCLQDYAQCEVMKPDGGLDTGYCDPQCRELDVGTIVQFERYGFCRLDSKDEKKLTFVYGHN